MNILLLAAGKGQRFQDQGYPPKPIIDVNGILMWRAVLNNFLEQFFWPDKTNVYVATKKEYGINNKVEPFEIINLEGPQLGAAHSALNAIIAANTDQAKPLIIMNCDQFIHGFDGEKFWQRMTNPKDSYDGGLIHFLEPNGENKWGRSILNGLDVTEIVEKTPVSPYAHTGHYYFARTYDFINYATKLINNDSKVNGEFFLSPIYNLMIEDGKKIGFWMTTDFDGIGIPEDLEKYLHKQSCNVSSNRGDFQ